MGTTGTKAGKMTTVLKGLEHFNFSHPHNSHPGFIMAFPKIDPKIVNVMWRIWFFLKKIGICEMVKVSGKNEKVWMVATNY